VAVYHKPKSVPNLKKYETTKKMRILVTGGTGMLGSAFKKIKTEDKLILIGSKDYDLRHPNEAYRMMYKTRPDGIIHLAAKVGGVKGNMECVADFFHDNIMINTNVLNSALRFNQDKAAGKPVKVLSLLSTCIYPDSVTYPLTVEQIHSGPPHESNFGYAYAKRMLDVHNRAIYSQYGYKWITAVPNNIYGQNDNFSLEHSHVIPALIRKISEAKSTSSNIHLWGDGTPLREFTYSKDIAEILLWLLKNYDEQLPINIGNPKEYSIKSIAENLCDILDYSSSKILWDINQPKGQYRKPSCNKELIEIGCPIKYTSLSEGLRNTCEWYLKHYPNIRGCSK
jgi:GDP-L-fucose synthase